jgi:hypothetical protein
MLKLHWSACPTCAAVLLSGGRFPEPEHVPVQVMHADLNPPTTQRPHLSLVPNPPIGQVRIDQAKQRGGEGEDENEYE